MYMLSLYVALSSISQLLCANAVLAGTWFTSGGHSDNSSGVSSVYPQIEDSVSPR